MYRLEPQFARVRKRQQQGWQDAIIAALGTGVDSTQIIESLKLTPTRRLDAMRRAAASLDGMFSRT